MRSMFCESRARPVSPPARSSLTTPHAAHLVRPEQPRHTVLALVRLETLKQRRRIVQDGRRRVELERRVGLDLGRAPPGRRVPGNREHCSSSHISTARARPERHDALWSVKVRPKTSWFVGGIVLGLLVSSISRRDGCTRVCGESSAPVGACLTREERNRRGCCPSRSLSPPTHLDRSSTPDPPAAMCATPTPTASSSEQLDRRKSRSRRAVVAHFGPPRVGMRRGKSQGRPLEADSRRYLRCE